jgi:hypothetical protein
MVMGNLRERIPSPDNQLLFVGAPAATKSLSRKISGFSSVTHINSGALILPMPTNAEVYLKLDVRPYAGEWIALVGGHIVAHGKDAETVYAEAKAKAPRGELMLNWVPVHDTLLF